MNCVSFRAVIDDPRTIHAPEGVVLPQGETEVVVRTVSAEASSANGDQLAYTRDWMMELAEEIERLAPDLPPDLAEHHDHYAHGKPLS